MSELIPYFCYSSSLDSSAFEEWKKSHGYLSFELPEGKLARALGYELAFNLFSNYWGGRVLGLKKSEQEGAFAEGVVFLIPAENWSVIEHKEGLRTGLSVPINIECEMDAKKIVAKAFTTPESRATSSGPVSALFKSLVANAYKKWGLMTDLDVIC